MDDFPLQGGAAGYPFTQPESRGTQRWSMEAETGSELQLSFILIQEQKNSRIDLQFLGNLIEQHFEVFAQIAVRGNRNFDGAKGLQMLQPTAGIFIQPGIDESQRCLVCKALQQQEFIFGKVAPIAHGDGAHTPDQLMLIFHRGKSNGAQIRFLERDYERKTWSGLQV
jgi:hypothetical protein